MAGEKFKQRISKAQELATRARERARSGNDEAAPESAPLGGSKAEAAQRLQVGFFGLGSMVLLVGLASILGSQADRAEEAAVPEAAPTTEPTEAAPQRDPLADAGIVPDIPADTDPEPDEELKGANGEPLPPLLDGDDLPTDDLPQE